MNDEKELCPFIKNKDRECYCNNMTSWNIQYIIEYCGNNYKECDIYEKLEESTKKEKIESLV